MTRKISPDCWRARRAAITRERVLVSARASFELLGFEGVDIRSIARDASLSTGSVFAHFASKEDLFSAAFPDDHERRRMAEAICLASGKSWVIGDRVPFYHAADRALSDLAVAA